MKIQGLSHITIIASDLERTARLLCEGLGAQEIYNSRERTYSIAPEKFFLLGGIWLAVMQGELSSPSYRHVAFKVNAEDLPVFETKLRSLGARIRPSRPRQAGEGESLYFYDDDDNLFELHTGSLEQRLASYGGTDE